MLDAPLDADVRRHGMNPRHVKSSAQADRLRKLGYAVVDYSVKRLAPPVVGRNVEPRNGAGAIHQLRSPFFKRHAAHEVCCALLRRQAWIKIRRFLLSLNTPVAAQHSGNSQMHPETSHNFLDEI